MRLTWLAYAYLPYDGYGRFSARLINALERAGVQVTPHFTGATLAPAWLQERWRLDWDVPVLTCLPPYLLCPLPSGARGPHWLLTMTEGSECPDGWAEHINKSGIDRVIVPCEWNAHAFREGGVQCPVSVIHGGTDPDEFPLLNARPDRPYTFLCLADRGSRKGWQQVWDAFYLAFGGKENGMHDVRLLIKTRPKTNGLVELIRNATNLDERIRFVTEDYDNMSDLYAQADCFAIPSHGEGWGMPHREAAMSGLPVITQRYSGMDDGHTHEWALAVERGYDDPISRQAPHIKGTARRPDAAELADTMRWCYEQRDEAAAFGKRAAAWLRANQTWDHSANALIALMQEHGVLSAPSGALEPEMEFA